MKNIETNLDEILHPDFWDCECPEDYIHPKTLKQCDFCGATESEQPNSIREEVERLLEEL